MDEKEKKIVRTFSLSENIVDFLKLKGNMSEYIEALVLADMNKQRLEINEALQKVSHERKTFQCQACKVYYKFDAEEKVVCPKCFGFTAMVEWKPKK